MIVQSQEAMKKAAVAADKRIKDMVSPAAVDRGRASPPPLRAHAPCAQAGRADGTAAG
jgi:hypothetical protein